MSGDINGVALLETQQLGNCLGPAVVEHIDDLWDCKPDCDDTDKFLDIFKGDGEDDWDWDWDWTGFSVLLSHLSLFFLQCSNIPFSSIFI